MIEFATPLQALDKFLVQYNVGQALLALFVLSVPGSLLVGSRKVLSLNLLGFGLLFLLSPASLTAEFHYRLLGLTLLVIGPVLYVTARK
jgi:hypothetical protein